MVQGTMQALGSCLLLLLLFGTSLGAPDSLESISNRRLQQQEVLNVTKENSKNFKKLVEGAQNGTSIEIATDIVEISSLITIKSAISVKGADGNSVKPTIKCTSPDAGIDVRSTDVSFENFIITNCDGAIRIVLPEESGDLCYDSPPQKPTLKVKISDVHFLSNKHDSLSYEMPCLPNGGGLSIGTGVDVTVTNSLFQGNVAQQGAGILVQLGASLRVKNSIFRDNIVDGNSAGGAIYAGTTSVVKGKESLLVIESCKFIRNADKEGKVQDRGYENSLGSDLEPAQFVFFKRPTPSGGAVHAIDMEKVKIIDSTFDGNYAMPAGGALHLENNEDVEISSCKFINNYVVPIKREPDAVVELGGAVYVVLRTQSTIKFSECTFENNTAAYGGALHMLGPSSPGNGILVPEIEMCIFNRNRASIAGGAAVVRNMRKVALDLVVFEENSAHFGGAMYVTNGAGVSVSTQFKEIYLTRFTRNRANEGGAIFALGAGVLEVTGAVQTPIYFSENIAVEKGGAVACKQSMVNADSEFQDILFEDNMALKGGAVYLESTALFAMQSSTEHIFQDSFFMEDLSLKNIFKGNKARAGGAVYLKPNSFQINTHHFRKTKFINNEAIPDMWNILEAFLPEVPASNGTGGRNLLQDPILQSETPESLIDPHSPDPCNPGGGGAVCIDAQDIILTSNIDILFLEAEFKDNSAATGGAIFSSTRKESSFTGKCTDVPGECKRIRISKTTLTGNRATTAGGTFFVTQPQHIFFELNRKNIVQLKDVDLSQFLEKSSVGTDGFGPDVASAAVSLEFLDPVPDDFGMIAHDHISGQTFVGVVVLVLDAFNQTVVGGINEAGMTVHVDSEEAFGQVVATAEKGIAKFSTIKVTALPSIYAMTFHGERVLNITGLYNVRPCLIGEYNVTESKICTNCSSGFFGIDPSIECDRCDGGANCTGGPVIAPHDGFWHSSPYSPLIHACLVSEACTYDGRNENLVDFFSNRTALDPSNKILLNEEYKLCSIGYEDVLCGSCSTNHGHIGGGQCSKCGTSRRRVILIMIAAGIKSLLMVLITLRSAMSSIRNINEVSLIQAAIKRASERKLARQATQARSLAAGVQGVDDADIQHGAVTVAGERELIEEPVAHENSASASRSWQKIPLENPLENPLEDDVIGGHGFLSEDLDESGHPISLVSVDHIIASDNISEIVKIATNFLQITNVALSINADWSSEVLVLLRVQDVLASVSGDSSWAPLDCILTEDRSLRPILGVVLKVFFPVVIMVIVMLLTCAVYVRNVRKGQTPQLKLKRYLIIVGMVSLFFAYENITQDLMRTVNCVTVDSHRSGWFFNKYLGAVGKYWGEDTIHRCYRGPHLWLVVLLGIPGLLFFSVGVPFGLLCFLERKKVLGLHKEQKFINTYGFIFQNYEERFVYWEVVIMIRKALIGAIIVYAYPLGPNLQGVLAQGVLVVALVLHLVAEPYKYRSLNILESASLVISITVYYAGIMYNDGKTGSAVQLLLTITIIVLNVGLAIYFLWKLMRLVDRILVARLENFKADVPTTMIKRAQKLAEVYVEIAKEVTERLKEKAHSQFKNAVKGGNSKSTKKETSLQMVDVQA